VYWMERMYRMEKTYRSETMYQRMYRTEKRKM
jgi:hypothetical protein